MIDRSNDLGLKSSIVPSLQEYEEMDSPKLLFSASSCSHGSRRVMVD